MRIIGFLILLAVIVAGFFGYPFYTINRLVGAIESGDAIVVDALVDWKQVRDGLRADLMREAGSKKSLIDTTSDASTAGSMLGMAIAGPMLDRMLETYANGQSLVDAAKKRPPESGDLLTYLHGARFVSPTVFQYALQDPKVRGEPMPVIMELQGLSWRVVRVIVPSTEAIRKSFRQASD